MLYLLCCSLYSKFPCNVVHCTLKSFLLFAGTVGTDTSWDIIKAVDYWEDDILDDEYVLVNQEDVVDGITSFMATYLLCFKQTKVTI
jgi:hypothetical protein